MYLWNAGLCLHDSKRWVLSLIRVSLLNLALLYISILSLLHSLQVGVPNVCTAERGLPCHRIEYLRVDLTILALSASGLKLVSVAAMKLAIDVDLLPSL